MDPPRLKPKAARVLGLAADDAAIDYGGMRTAAAAPLTPVSLRSVDSGGGGGGGSTWVPDWPEPDDGYVAALMQQRRGPGRRSSGGGAEDPLAVWHAEAVLPARAGVPAGATNAWRRRHGLQRPLDPLLVAQWGVSLALAAGYFALVRPLAALAQGGGGAAESAAVVAALALSLATSAIDPQAPEAAPGRAPPRDLHFQQQWGAPAIDAATGVCRVCRVAAQPRTRHCKRCNKCVAHMDHHCRYLGTCIGRRNYACFFAAMCAAAAALGAILARAGYLVYVCGWHKDRFVALAAALPGAAAAPPAAWPAAVSCALAAYVVLAAAAAVLVGRLLALHVLLCCRRITTIEYEAMRARAKDPPPEAIPMVDPSAPAPSRASPPSPPPASVRSVLRKAARALALSATRWRRARYRRISNNNNNTATHDDHHHHEMA
ncbi:hypothetical protein H4R18_000889 [Coemansia javaensis]|uniref:Palmitoyltransferase n=1 Tax=Coemansia javaensis TaxID=2761396 RepID=A0A9W8LLI1_9FUNG|nr:hypothetical protein H4R18_000889 [Coemansia javaensis]